MTWMSAENPGDAKRNIPKHTLGFWVLGLAPDLSDADAVEAHDVLLSSISFVPRSTWSSSTGTDLNEVSLTACAYADDRLLVSTGHDPP